MHHSDILPQHPYSTRSEYQSSEHCHSTHKAHTSSQNANTARNISDGQSPIKANTIFFMIAEIQHIVRIMAERQECTWSEHKYFSVAFREYLSLKFYDANFQFHAWLTRIEQMNEKPAMRSESCFSLFTLFAVAYSQECGWSWTRCDHALYL